MGAEDGANGIPSVSVVIPFYNREHCLHRAIESVIAQTFSDWEVVLVDDGSRDRSPEIAQDFVEKYPDRIRLIRQENQGGDPARNRAISASRGSLIGILDSDDAWDPRFLDRTHAAFTRCPEVDWVYVNARRVQSEDGVVLVPSVFDDDRSLDFRRLATRSYGDLNLIVDPDLLVTAIRSTVKAGANSLVRRSVFERVTYPVGIRVGGDRALVMAAIAAEFRFGYIDEVLLTVNHHGDNISAGTTADSTRFMRLQEDLIRAYEWVESHVPLDSTARAAMKERLGQLYFNYAAGIRDTGGSMVTLFRYLAKSIIVSPKKNPVLPSVLQRLQPERSGKDAAAR